MVILGTQNKMTDFLMILAWLCRFTHKALIIFFKYHGDQKVFLI